MAIETKKALLLSHAQIIKNYTDTVVKAVQDGVDLNTSAIAVLNGDKSQAGSVQKTVADAIAAIVADAPESLDTLKEISDWITTHADSAAEMNSLIQTNKTDIGNLATLLGTLPEGAASATFVAYISEAIGKSQSDLTDAIATAKTEAIEAAAADATTKANTAETNAKAYADGLVAADSALDVRIKAVETKASANETAIEAINNVDTGILKNAKDYADTLVAEGSTIDTRIKNVEDKTAEFGFAEDSEVQNIFTTASDVG